jgi:hypothetical protein
MDIQRVGLRECEGLSESEIVQKIEAEMPEFPLKVLLVVTDFTRGTTMVERLVFRYLKKKNYIIDIAVASGMHRSSTMSELRSKLGDGLEDCVVYQNHPFQENDWLEEIKEKEDYKVIVLSNAYPHNHVGMSGGPKMILPGLSHWADVVGFHKASEKNCIENQMYEAARKVVDIYIGIAYTATGCYDVMVSPYHEDYKQWAYRVKDFYEVEITSPLPDAVILEPCVKNSDFQQSMNAMLIGNDYHIVKRGGTIIILSYTPDGLGTHYLFQQPNGKSPAFYDEVFDWNLCNGRQIHFCMPQVPERGIQQYFKHSKPMNFPDFEDAVRFIQSRHGQNCRVVHYTAPDISIGVR